jgi:hypothetical protein
MLGLKQQKKQDKTIRTYLQEALKGEGAKFDLMFSADDGLWDLNFALNHVEGFQENWSINEAYQAIYSFLFKLVQSIEQQK